MKKFKLFIVIFLSFFLLCGCNAEYNLTINKDLTVEESFNAYEKKETIKEISSLNSYNEFLEQIKNESSLNTKKYQIRTYSNGNFFGGKVKRIYPSIENYVENINMNNLFNTETSYNVKNNIATFSSKVIFEENEELVSVLYKIDTQIKIKVPFKVIDSNADNIDTDKNIYTWNLNNYTRSQSSEDIRLIFDINQKTNDLSSTLLIFISLIVLIPLVCMITIFYKKNKKTNNI